MTDAEQHGHSARPEIAVRAEELTYEADGVVSVRLARPDGARLPAWEPGAHIDLILPTGLVRQYSLVESGPDLSWYRIAVFHEPLSRGGSEYVHWFLRPGNSPRSELRSTISGWWKRGSTGSSPAVSASRRSSR